MFKKIYDWFVKYDVEISWFLTGWFGAYFCIDFSQGNWVGALIDAVIVIANITYFRK